MSSEAEDRLRAAGRPRLLTIAGSDSGGGAGVQADLKTFAAHGGFGMSVITAITAQNTVEVRAVHSVPPAVVEAQIAAVFDDIGVDAVKIGMLASAELVSTVAAGLRKYEPRHVVLDPVMVSKSGASLLEDSAVDALIHELLPLATVVTPNLPEAERLTGLSLGTNPSQEDRIRAGRKMRKLAHATSAGPPLDLAVLVKGGHADGPQVQDLLWLGGQFHVFEHSRLDSTSTHGTGCTLSSAIAARLGLGDTLLEAVPAAIDYLHGAIAAAYPIGGGHGPVDHLYRLLPREHPL